MDYNILRSSLSARQQARTTIFQGMCENPRFSVWCHKAPQLISHIGKLTSHRLYYKLQKQHKRRHTYDAEYGAEEHKICRSVLPHPGKLGIIQHNRCNRTRAGYKQYSSHVGIKATEDHCYAKGNQSHKEMLDEYGNIYLYVHEH